MDILRELLAGRSLATRRGPGAHPVSADHDRAATSRTRATARKRDASPSHVRLGGGNIVHSLASKHIAQAVNGWIAHSLTASDLTGILLTFTFYPPRPLRGQSPFLRASAFPLREGRGLGRIHQESNYFHKTAPLPEAFLTWT